MLKTATFVDNSNAEKEPSEDKEETNSRVQEVIRKKLCRHFNSKDFDESQFDLLLLEGLDLGW